ncbi:Tectonin beta-propeller repeat-containing protein [Gryllus bimaculatus]|nr:Tectonin beta-propeller repeat-containing protein [Gryllus bimaculatus]
MVFKCFPDGFSPGSVVTVTGYVHSDPVRFEINLQCGPVVSPDIVGDIALHFNPRFDEDLPVIVRNTKSNGQWGYEERDGGFFFKPNQNVSIQIYSERRGYKIIVDDFPFIYYKHRQDLSTVTHLSIRGDIDVQEVCYKAAPILEDEFQVPKPPATSALASFSFSVNLVCGKNPEEDCDFCCPLTVALHYDVRFYPSNLIVRNTLVEGEWGDEETDECFTFTQDNDFTLRFDCKEEHFQIYVNKLLTSTYRHRISPLNISYVYVHGGVGLYDVNMMNL